VIVLKTDLSPIGIGEADVTEEIMNTLGNYGWKCIDGRVKCRTFNPQDYNLFLEDLKTLQEFKIRGSIVLMDDKLLEDAPVTTTGIFMELTLTSTGIELRRGAVHFPGAPSIKYVKSMPMWTEVEMIDATD